jgi:hypothetical protein
MVKNRKLGPFYFAKEVRAAFKKLKEYFKSALIFRLYNPKLSIRFETDISKFVVEIIISQLFPIEDNKRKIILFDYVLIAEINKRGKKLRYSRCRTFNYNRNVQKMAILFRKNLAHN